ncbi:MAG: class I SAM-dependent RNA methyltransferase [Burkholderiales bacterium]|nr:class I SAM-dependent RNA methyltransferase [Burkholderiales bacterium]
MNASPLFLPCPQGVEALLAEEARALLGPHTSVDAGRGGVFVGGDERAAMRLNLESRLATRVLWPLAEGPYRDEQDLYALARRVPWALWITPAQTLKVDVSARRSPLTSLNFAALRIKDAVCDHLREATGARPSVDTRRPDLPLVLFVGEEQAALYADLSGEPLFKRGWRDDTGEAPLKETLAAAMLAAAGWQGRAEDGPLFDPMCGAGTIAIEAAQLACGIAPGLARRFAFERQAPFKPLAGAWREMQAAARARVHAPAVPVFAGDVSFRMTDFAARNAERAGVRGAIDFKTADALQRSPPIIAGSKGGTMVVNPPYGERIEAKGSTPRGREAAHAAHAPHAAIAREGFEGGGAGAEFFAALASHWKREYAGWTAWVLSPDMKLPSLMRLKESRRVPLWNGPIECRLFRFDLVAGSARG